MMNPQILITEDDWSIRKYEVHPWSSLVHTHIEGGAGYVMAAGSAVLEGYRCYKCRSKAPESLITVWTLLNFDNFGNFDKSL